MTSIPHAEESQQKTPSDTQSPPADNHAHETEETSQGGGGVMTSVAGVFSALGGGAYNLASQAQNVIQSSKTQTDADQADVDHVDVDHVDEDDTEKDHADKHNVDRPQTSMPRSPSVDGGHVLHSSSHNAEEMKHAPSPQATDEDIPPTTSNDKNMKESNDAQHPLTRTGEVILKGPYVGTMEGKGKGEKDGEGEGQGEEEVAEAVVPVRPDVSFADVVAKGHEALEPVEAASSWTAGG